MAKKGGSGHLSSLAAPRFLGIERKAHVYVMEPNPGRHTRQTSMPLQLAMRRMGISEFAKDISRLIRNGGIAVNGRTVKEPKYPVGLNDVIEIRPSKKSYEIGMDNKAKATVTESKGKGHEGHLFRVVGKYKAKAGVIMARLHDGSSVKVDNAVKVNDSLSLGAKGDVKKVLPLKEGAKCLVIEGVHVGTEGTVSSIRKGSMSSPASAVIRPSSGQEFETVIRNIMVTG